MPFELIRNDITRMQVDAIVNAANASLLGGGGVDGAIHRAAGPELLHACRALGGCETGQAKITPGFRLPCRYVIHTVGPVWQDGRHGEARLLASCYRQSLELALVNGCETVAFPLISAGAYGCPRDVALKTATDTIRDFLLEHDMTVYLVVYDPASFAISRKLYANIQAFIDDASIDMASLRRENSRPLMDLQPLKSLRKPPLFPLPKQKKKRPAAPEDAAADAACAPDAAAEDISLSSVTDGAAWDAPRPSPIPAPGQQSRPAGGLDAYLAQMDEGFRDMLFRKIDERHMTDAECYKKANLDRKLFNKIKNQPEYRPGKPTVLALAVALRLSLPETREMLGKAGFSLSHSSKFDLIVEYFIRQENYDIFEINEALFTFDQKLLGSAV